MKDSRQLNDSLLLPKALLFASYFAPDYTLTFNSFCVLAPMESFRTILSSMDTIGLEEMDAYALMNRVDTKYVFSVSHLLPILEGLSHDHLVLNVDGLTLSPYENLYFDTPHHQCYLQHHNGQLIRRKFRIRRYVVSDLCFFEIKTKNNKGQTTKERIPVERMEHALPDDSQEYLRSRTGKSPELLPQLWCEFSRITLVARQRQERATIDTDLAFSYNGKRLEFPNVTIAEVKQLRKVRTSPMREVFRHHRIRETRLSKYCLGCTSLKPHLKYNRFKSTLNAIQRIALQKTPNGNLRSTSL